MLWSCMYSCSLPSPSFRPSTCASTLSSCSDARASRARAAVQRARLVRACGGHGHGNDAPTVSSAGYIPVSPLLQEVHTLTVDIGSPPQPHSLILDTNSDLVWTQCALYNGTAKVDEPLYDPAKSSTFSLVPCSHRLCELSSQDCTKNGCPYEIRYGSGAADGVLAWETFTFGTYRKVRVPVAFGCGRLVGAPDALHGSSGLTGFSLEPRSIISQLGVAKFSVCLTPFGQRKTSPLLFGDLVDLSRYKNAAPIQTTLILKNPVAANMYYY